MPKTIYRQGDVVLEEIGSIPKDAVKVSGELRVQGETGHEHVLKASVYEMPQTVTAPSVPMPFIRWAEVEEGGALITHTEVNGHPALHIPKGLYLVRRVRNYTFDKVRDVVD